MAVAADVAIGIVGAVLAGIPLIADLLAPKADDSITTTVRIIAGDGDFTDGDQPHVHLFDRSGNSIGASRGSDNTIHRGQPRDVQVRQADPSRSANGAEYLALAAAGLNDAICVSIVTVTTPTGVTYNWMGDVGFQCGLPWTYGNVMASESSEFGRVIPKCVWLDGDASNGIKTQGVGIHLPSFTSNEGREADYGRNNDHMCKSKPRLSAYEKLDFLDPIPYFKEPVADDATLVDFGDKALDEGNWDTKPTDTHGLEGLGRKTRRQAHAHSNTTRHDDEGRQNTATPPPRPGSGHGGKVVPYGQSGNAMHRGRLVKSAHPSHSARELCESATSWGPDFVSLKEKLYCDMDTKTLWPCCGGDVRTACFDVEANAMRKDASSPSVRRRALAGRRIPRKTYGKVQEWGV